MNINEQKWHALRAKNVGGSEVADLFNEGFNSYYQLWHIKNGTMERPDLSGIEYVDAGNYLEGAIIKWANDRWGFDFEPGRSYYMDKEIRGMGCTPDAISRSSNRQICQVKNVDSIMFGRDWQCEGEIITEAPLKYLLQVQHEMFCTGAEEAVLVALVGGRALKYMTIYPDPELQQIIKDAVEKFWRSIEIGNEPEPDFKIDLPNLVALRHSKPISAKEIATDSNYIPMLCAQYLAAAAEEKAAIEEKRRVSAELLHLAGQHKKILCDGYKITIVDIAESLGTEITEDMVGQRINARKASSYPRITPIKEKENDQQ